MSEVRASIASARSILVKIGSSAVTEMAAGLARDRIDALVDAIEARIAAGTDVVVVSSGAVGGGLAPLGLKRRPNDLATKQAAASVGQLELAHAWGTSFARYGRPVGQVLLTAHDVSWRSHHRNAQRTLDRLRSLGAVAVVNENDTVATSELRFGDNDRLAALVAHMCTVDALVLLSDVDGLYDGDPRRGGATLIPEVSGPDDLADVVAGSGGALGTGGMASKLSSATLAADSGIPVLLAAAKDADRALTDAGVGTVFAPQGARMSARKFWLRYAAESTGRLVLDDGAVRAVAEHRRSLLGAGVIEVGGHFFGGDVVDLVDAAGVVRARGVSAYDAAELVGRTGREPSGRLLGRPVVHANDLVAVRSSR